MNAFYSLCSRDPRNPVYESLYGYDDEEPTPRSRCACDNCFYGRDEMAVEILRMFDRDRPDAGHESVRVVAGTYGSDHTLCHVFVYDYDDIHWYAVRGSRNVNCTGDPVEEGVNVERLKDVDTITAPVPITSEEEFLQALK